MKRLFNIIIASVLAFVGFTAVKAANDGSIVINRTETNYKTTYNAYRLFDLSFDQENDSYAYTLNDKWSAFFTTGEGNSFVEISDITNAEGKKYVTLKSGADVASLAKKALAYAKANSVANDGSTNIAKGESSATISGLPLGYYLVDSSLGATCHLSSTAKQATVDEKNAEPTIAKTAQTAINGTAKIGDEVSYTVTITPADGYENYVFKDLMTSGLTYNKNAQISYAGATPTGAVIDNNTGEGYTFKIDFSNVNLEGVTSITITYSATINKNAIDENATQSNAATLSFGDNNTTDSTQAKVDTTTYNAKFKKVSDKNKNLSGARFKLYDAQTNGNEIKVVKVSDGVYRVAEEGETAVEYIEAGSVTIKGLAGTKYYLEEIAAPEGFTKLGSRVELTADNNTELPVVNTTGTVLPTTGGVGTKLFILIGSIMVLSLGTVLIAKFRMSKEA